MDQLTNIILEYIEQRSIKDKAIRRQDYQLAATSRDNEREISRQFYNLLNNVEDTTFKWDKYEMSIKNYLYSEFGVNSYDKDYLIKLMNRKNNLDNLSL